MEVTKLVMGSVKSLNPSLSTSEFLCSLKDKIIEKYALEINIKSGWKFKIQLEMKINLS